MIVIITPFVFQFNWQRNQTCAVDLCFCFHQFSLTCTGIDLSMRCCQGRCSSLHGLTINNGNRASGVQNRTTAKRESDILITSMIPDWIGRHHWYRDYFMESAYVRDFHTSWWSIWNRTSERSERVRFLIQNQRAGKSRTKRFPCSNLFISYILRFLLFIQL